ncbi:MAG: hypothetical protein E7617_06040 [Ruminococcaceae bacterium]|nr:hypothetical protein [Oscillospiraceae bacterium]
MKLLAIDSSYYKFPEGFETLEEFIDFVNNSEKRFIRMTEYLEDNCRAPYLIEEDQLTVYINILAANVISEVSNVKILSRAEYKERLREVVRKKCIDCVNFNGDPDGVDTHFERLSLDGDCWSYEKRED